MSEQIVQKMRDVLDADIALRHATNTSRHAITITRWNGMAEMIALAAGTDSTIEFNEAQHRYRESKWRHRPRPPAGTTFRAACRSARCLDAACHGSGLSPARQWQRRSREPVTKPRLENTMTPSELSEYLDDDPSGKLMVGDLANRYGWTGGTVGRNGDDVVARLTRPNGRAIELAWNSQTLVRAVRGTRADLGWQVVDATALPVSRGKIEAKGDAFTGRAMLQIVAGWLEDTE